MTNFEVDLGSKLGIFMEGVKARSRNLLNPNDNPYKLNTKQHFWWSNGWNKYNEFLIVFSTED